VTPDSDGHDRATLSGVWQVAKYRTENADTPNVLGTLGATLRTAFVAVGFVVLFAGIVTLAHPPLLGSLAPGLDAGTGTGTGAQTGGGVGPTLFLSLGGIVVGLTVISTGLAMPGRTPHPLIGEQPFTRRQRAFVLLGAVLMLGLPVAVWAVLQSGVRSLALVLAAAVLIVVGALLVLVGTATGLKHGPRPPQNS
jgi:hypothetical protein